MHAVPVTLGILVTFLLGLIALEYWLAHRPWVARVSLRWLDYLLLALLLLTAVALGVLVIYIGQSYSG